MIYKKVELQENVPVQYLAVYITHWKPEWGRPEIGFVEVDSDEIDIESIQAEAYEAGYIAGIGAK
jgi:hypothetical protein